MAWSDDSKLGSGLPDRFQFTVTAVKVGYPYEKNPTQSAVVFDGESRIDDEINDEHLWLKAGTQFESGDQEGTFLVHQAQTPDNYDTRAEKPKKINKNSAYGKFLHSFLDVAGTGPLEQNQDPSRNKFEIWDVMFWQGMILDIEVVEEPYDFKSDSGEQVTGSSRQPYVRAFLGKSDGSVASVVSTSAGASTNGPVDEAKAMEIARLAPNFIKHLEAITEAGVDPSHEYAQNAFYSQHHPVSS